MATRGYYQRTVRGASGAAISGASVAVEDLNGNPAALEDQAGVALSQPLTTNLEGTFSFWVVYGIYNIVVTDGATIAELPAQIIGPDKEITDKLERLNWLGV